MPPAVPKEVEAVRNGWFLKVTSVEVAFAEVVAKLRIPIVLMFEKLAVEEACNPAWNQIGVEVEFASAPKLVVEVHGNANDEPDEPLEARGE